MTAGSLPSRCRAFLTAPMGSPILSILKYLAYSGSSLSGGPVSSSSSFSSLLSWLLTDLSWSRSIIEGSLPSRSNAFFTAPIGSPILSILKYFAYSGSSFSGGPVSFPSSSSPLSFFSWLLTDLFGSRSMMEGSTPSLCRAFFTAPMGSPILSILKYLA